MKEYRIIEDQLQKVQKKKKKKKKLTHLRLTGCGSKRSQRIFFTTIDIIDIHTVHTTRIQITKYIITLLRECHLIYSVSNQVSLKTKEEQNSYKKAPRAVAPW